MRRGIAVKPKLDPAYGEQEALQQAPPHEVLMVGPDTPEMIDLEAFLRTAKTDYRITRAEDLQQALQVLQHTRIAIVLCDLTLATPPWRTALEQLAIAAPRALRIGLAGSDDGPSQAEARYHGAHDTFTLSRLDPYWLPHLLDTALHLTQPKCISQEPFFESVGDTLPLGILTTDMHGNIRHSNANYRNISGEPEGLWSDRHWMSRLHPDDRPRVAQEWHQAFANSTACHIEARMVRPDTSIVWISINAARLPEAGGYIQTVEDITSRKHVDGKLHATEEALYIEKERALVTLNSIGDAVISTDTACRVTYLNRVAEEMTGWSRESALGRKITEVFRIIDVKSRQAASDPARRAIEENRVVGLAMGTILIGRDGCELAIEDSAAPIHDRNGLVTGAVIVFHHVNQSQTIASRMSHLAQHDALTDLPNRVLLEERLSRAIGLAQRHRLQVALLFIDLDDFKAINDRLGHSAGDALLQSIASRLNSCVRDTDTVSRLGGDEFVILLTEIHGIDDARRVAEAILRALLPPHQAKGHVIDITASLGISLYPDSGTTPDELLHRADTAMYHTKRHGCNGYRFFTMDMLPDFS
jgi:diguanylate cyclase (GGDEF)-like protein/PAS domain S-box-containing protein